MNTYLSVLVTGILEHDVIGESDRKWIPHFYKMKLELFTGSYCKAEADCKLSDCIYIYK